MPSSHLTQIRHAIEQVIAECHDLTQNANGQIIQNISKQATDELAALVNEKDLFEDPKTDAQLIGFLCSSHFAFVDPSALQKKLPRNDDSIPAQSRYLLNQIVDAQHHFESFALSHGLTR